MSETEPKNIAPSFAQPSLNVGAMGELSLAQVQQISPAALAYLGDAVYELYVRHRYILPPKRIQNYHHQVVEQVRAETQAQYLQSIEPYLSDREREIVRRGRNAAFGRPKRLSARIYQQATSLETLIGYLYLSDPQRLNELLTYLESNYEPQIPKTDPQADEEKSSEDCQSQ